MRLATFTASLMLFVFPLAAEEVPFDGDGWDITAEDHRIEEKNGQTALYLKSGVAFVKDETMQDGVIEFDILITGERGFSGSYFRIGEGNNAEHFYIRPHQNGQVDANQYNPVFNGLAGWQMYFGPRFSAQTTYALNEWMHIKIVFAGSKADIYIDSDEPVLHVDLKHSNTTGGFGINSGFAPAWFANFKYEKIETPDLTGSLAGDDLKPGEGAILNWAVSSAMPESAFAGTTRLPEAANGNLTWQTLAVEDLGYANLARIQGISPEANTTLAKVTITSENDTERFVQFGYSDRVKVYLNGDLLYSGNNTYRTRDYRYLGTIGLFDEVPLNLKAGENELVFAVSESFGGWAIMAAIEDREGLEITP